MDGVVADDEAVTAPALKRHCFDGMPAQIDSDYGVRYFGSHVGSWKEQNRCPDTDFLKNTE
jgi:hypothetical protein